MKILSINTGSSSLKFNLYEMPEEKSLISGKIERIGENSQWKITTDTTEKYERPLKNFDEAVEVLIDALKEKGIIKDLSEIKAIGHRIVNGKDHYKSEIVTDEVIKYLESIKDLSKVHMPGHIAGIKAFKNLLPDIPQVVNYDTAFHHTISKERFLYAVPYEWYKNYSVRKYGFHGISCEYVTTKMEEVLNKKVNLIICHIGYGASVTLVENSTSIDTSMGFTANEGLIMGSRSGNIDYSFLPYIQEKTGKSLNELDDILNYKSGLEGFVKGGGDNRDLMEKIEKGDENAIIINEMFENRVVDYIAKYYVRIDNIDAIVFCGGVGENSPIFRKNVINKLSKLGLIVDEEANENGKKSSYNLITKETSSLPCYVVLTDEELMIARKTCNLIK